jgi:hypothetical protein
VHASKKLEVRRAFVLAPDQVRLIYDVLSARQRKCEISVSCAGNITLGPASVEDLLTINNVGAYRIRSITIGSIWSGDGVGFSTNSGAPITVQVSGESDEVLKTYDDLERAIAPALRFPWPGLLDIFTDSELRVVSFILPFIVVATCLGAAAGKFSAATAHGVGRTGNFLAGSILLVVAAAVALLAPFLGHFAFTKVFPKGVFLIGGGVEEYSEIKSRRQVFSPIFIIATIILGIFCAVIVHFIGL